MKLYFQSGKNKRLAIDTENKTYCTNYWFLGGWKEYIKVSDTGYRELLAQCINDGYTYSEN